MAVGENRGNKLGSTERVGEGWGLSEVVGQQLLWGFKPEVNKAKHSVQ